MNVTDDRQTDDRRTAIAYSEREREFTFAKNEVVRDTTVVPTNIRHDDRVCYRHDRRYS